MQITQIQNDLNGRQGLTSGQKALPEEAKALTRMANLQFRVRGLMVALSKMKHLFFFFRQRSSLFERLGSGAPRKAHTARRLPQQWQHA